jgi:nucleotide-binding universal stress UspA family protein
MFSRILVGVGGSERSARALAVATELAVAERGRLTLTAIVRAPSPSAWGGPFSPDELRRDAERYYERLLCKTVEAVREQVPTIRLVRHGRAAHCLLDEVRRDHYHCRASRLILRGTPGRAPGPSGNPRSSPSCGVLVGDRRFTRPDPRFFGELNSRMVN